MSDFNLEGKNPKFARHTKNLVLEKVNIKSRKSSTLPMTNVGESLL